MAKKILLADDSVTIQKVVELILSEGDYELKVFSNGEEAFQYIQQDKPDIVLADVEMPGLNGYQLCEKIKNDPNLKDIPVILLSGAFEPLDENRATEVGADDNIVKPFESSELVNKINGLLANKTPASEETEEVQEISEEISIDEEKAFEIEEESISQEPTVEAEEEEFIIEETSEEDLWEEELAKGEGYTEATVATDEFIVEETAQEEPKKEVPSMEQPEQQPNQQEQTQTISESISSEDIQRPIKEGLERLFQQLDESVKTIIDESISQLNLQQSINSTIQEKLSQHLENLLTQKLPPMLEEGIKNTVQKLSEELKTEIERILWDTVPDLAETIITKEIEKIKSSY